MQIAANQRRDMRPLAGYGGEMRRLAIGLVLVGCGGSVAVEPMDSGSADAAPQTQNDAPEEAEASLEGVDGSSGRYCVVEAVGAIPCGPDGGGFQVARPGSREDCATGCEPGAACVLGDSGLFGICR